MTRAAQAPAKRFDALIARLRLQPEDIGGPSRIDMLRERLQACEALDVLCERIEDSIRHLDEVAILIEADSPQAAIESIERLRNTLFWTLHAPKKNA